MRMKNDNKQTRRRFLKATGGAAGAAALAGCLGGGDGGGNQSSGGGNGSGGNQSGGNGGNQQTQQNVKANPNAVLRDINSTMTTLDPVAVADTASGEVAQQIFDPLMNYPDGKAATEKLLAKNYQVSDDYLTYTFNIKKGVKFHNGKSLTAKDFVYSFERLASSSNSLRSYFILDSLGVKHETKTVTKDGEQTEVYKPNSLAVTAVDDTTLRIELSEPFHAALKMLAYGSFAVVPEGIVGDIKGYKGRVPYNQFANSPKGAGTGPFKFKKWQQGTEAAVTRNQNWHGGKVSVGGMHWQILSDPTAQYNYFVNKNADITQFFPTAKYDPSKISINQTDDLGREHGTYGPLRNGETVNYLAVSTINTYYVGFNMEKIPKPVRKAFAYVANQDLFVQQVFKGRGTPAYHFTPPNIYPGGQKAYKQHAKQKYPYGYGMNQSSGVQKARQVMEKAGYGPNNKFTVNWTQYQSDTWLELAKLFRQRLASAHINMKIQQADFSTLITRGRAGKLDAYTLGWVSDWPAPDNFVQLLNPPQTQTEKSAPVSYINWSPKLKGTSAAKRAKRSYNKIANNQAPTKQAQKIRNKNYIDIEEANWTDMGFLPIYHGLQERWYYDWAEVKPFGGMGPSRQKYESAKVGNRN
jgi:ABC-type transport system substrate-binding protein